MCVEEELSNSSYVEENDTLSLDVKWERKYRKNC